MNILNGLIAIKFLSLSVIIFITGCTAPTDERLQSSVDIVRQDANSQDQSSKIDVLACKEKGGEIKKVCMQGVDFCIQSHLDEGKICNDSSECSGECRIESKTVKSGTKTSGFCSANNNPCGCFQTIEKGVAEPMLCVD